MSAYTRSELDGATATSIFPSGDLGSPGDGIRDHVDPPSRDTYTPLPGPPLFSPYVCISTCQFPANSTRGFSASIESPEQPVFWSTNSTRSQCAPPSVVRYTPRS